MLPDPIAPVRCGAVRQQRRREPRRVPAALAVWRRGRGGFGRARTIMRRASGVAGHGRGQRWRARGDLWLLIGPLLDRRAAARDPRTFVVSTLGGSAAAPAGSRDPVDLLRRRRRRGARHARQRWCSAADGRGAGRAVGGRRGPAAPAVQGSAPRSAAAQRPRGSSCAARRRDVVAASILSSPARVARRSSTRPRSTCATSRSTRGTRPGLAVRRVAGRPPRAVSGRDDGSVSRRPRNGASAWRAGVDAAVRHCCGPADSRGGAARHCPRRAPGAVGLLATCPSARCRPSVGVSSRGIGMRPRWRGSSRCSSRSWCRRSCSTRRSTSSPSGRRAG